MPQNQESPAQEQPAIIPCSVLAERREQIEAYAKELKVAASGIGSHGLSDEDFWNSGIFQGAIERIRGTQSASTSAKKAFLSDVLSHMKALGAISEFGFAGSDNRHDYQVEMPGATRSVFEAKGCLDGENTNHFQRPPDADEFAIWSLCQNKGADPRHNAWSGIHTRLGAKIVSEGARVDALIIWDMLCGTVARPCPKLVDPARATMLPSGLKVPPPCIYLFPRTKPDARNNPNPLAWRLEELPFIRALATTFRCKAEEIVQVRIQTQMNGANIERKTTLTRAGVILRESKWTPIKRASS